MPRYNSARAPFGSSWDRWPSGLRHTLGKRAWCNSHRGFESRPVRQSIARSAVFAGKAIGIACFIAAVTAVIIPVTALFFAIDLATFGPGLTLIALAAIPGIAASGTLFAAMTVRTRARDLVLASVLFPLLAPTLLAAVAATRELLGGRPLAELVDYFEILGVFGVVFATGGIGLSETLLDG